MASAHLKTDLDWKSLGFVGVGFAVQLFVTGRSSCVERYLPNAQIYHRPCELDDLFRGLLHRPFLLFYHP